MNKLILLRLSLKNLRFNLFKILFLFLGLTSIGIIFYLLTSLAFGLKTNIVDRYLQTAPVNEITVSRKSMVIPLPFINNFSFDSGADLTDSALSDIRGLAGVERIYPIASINFPISIYIDLFGYQFQSDLAITGIPEELVSEDKLETSKPFSYDQSLDESIPALVSYSIIDLYNSNFAEAHRLPKLSYQAVLGKHFTLIFGTSSFGPTGKEQRIRCEIVGLSRRAEILGMSIPLSAVIDLNRWFNSGYVPRYSGAILKTAQVADVPRLTERIRSMKLNVYSLQDIIGRINSVSAAIASIAAILLLSVTLTVFFNLFNYFLTLIKNQQQEIAMLRYIGFALADIRGLYLYQSLLIAAFSAVITILVSRGLIMYIDRLLSSQLMAVAGLSVSVFYIPGWLDLAFAGGMILVTWLTVYGAVRKTV